MIHIYFTGIDLGSTMTTVVIKNRNEEICVLGVLGGVLWAVSGYRGRKFADRYIEYEKE